MMQKRLLVWVVLFLLCTASPAWAYLDPSSGSMMLQIILGGLAGLGVGLRLFWRRILSALSMGRALGRADQEPESKGGA